MTASKKRRPKTDAKVPSNFTPKTTALLANTLNSWSIKIIDRDGPFSWENCKEYETVFKKLQSFEGCSWKDLYQGGSHNIEVKDLSKAAKHRLAQIKQEDLDEVFSLRYTAKKRIIGIRRNDTIQLLWWDPEHKVCLSKKKNT